MIELQNISRIYDTAQGPLSALSDLSLKIEKGEIFGVIGKSGAGKSTLIRCVNLLERPNQGSVIIDQQDLMTLSDVKLRQVRHQIGMIFQHFNLVSQLTVFDNIALPLRLIGKDKSHISQRVNDLLDLVGLSERHNAYPAQLSGGQKQRVAIARALACKPKILLCDEATSSLDPQTTQTILQLLKQINQELGITIMMITHEMDVVKMICQRAAVIADGSIAELNDTLSLFLRPQNPITKELVHSSLRDELSDSLKARIKPAPAPDLYPLLRLNFLDSLASQPIISHLVKQFSIDINLFQANIGFIQHQSVGTLILELLTQDPAQIKQAIDYLKQHNVQIEELGYVSRDAASIN